METEQPNWHSLSAEQALASVQSDRNGLSAGDAEVRLRQFGRNELPLARQRGPLRRFLTQFNNLLIYVLLVAAVITLATGHVTDAVVIVAVAFLNAVIGFLQEGKAEKALGAIRQMLSANASVLRNGNRTTVPAAELTPS